MFRLFLNIDFDFKNWTFYITSYCDAIYEKLIVAAYKIFVTYLWKSDCLMPMSRCCNLVNINRLESQTYLIFLLMKYGLWPAPDPPSTLLATEFLARFPPPPPPAGLITSSSKICSNLSYMDQNCFKSLFKPRNALFQSHDDLLWPL